MRGTSASLVLAYALAACAGEPTRESARAPATVAHPAAPASPAALRLHSERVAEVPVGTFGPYLGMSPEAGIAVWASQNDAGRRFFYARPFAERGPSMFDPLNLGEAPKDLGLVSVRPMRSGFALISTRQISDGEAVEFSLLSPKGERITGPVFVGQSPRAILWIEAIAEGDGANLLWAASEGGRAEIWIAYVSRRGELAGPRLLARDAGAWQAVAFGRGLALAVAHVGKAPGQHGPIEVTLLEGKGAAPLASPAAVVVDAETSADLDLDMAASGEDLLLAWSDHRGGESRVFSAVVNREGKVVAKPSPATPPFGEQALLRVVAPAFAGAPAYLAWEALDAAAPNHRTFQVASLAANGRIGSARGLFEYWKLDGSMPEAAATKRGIAVLTLAPVCKRSAPCTNDAAVLPEFVEFDAGFEVRSSEPIFPASSGSTNRGEVEAGLAWDLNCPDDACYALSADYHAPSAVVLTRLERLSNDYRAAATRAELPPPPRIVSDEALTTSEPLSQVALADTSAGRLLAWITDFDPTTPWVKLKKAAPDGRLEPLRARIDVQGFGDGEGGPSPLSEPVHLSLRAHSLGGVALAASRAGDDALLAWAGLDGGEPQVFLTLLDKFGKKTAQRMLTHKSGDLSDLAVVPIDRDYLLGWVDERNGDAEVYATKVSASLKSSAPEQRITQTPGAATDLSLVATANGVLAVWADSRQSEQAGAADIYAAAIRVNDAGKDGPEVALQKTHAHSFAPVVKSFDTGAVVAWLEAASPNDGEASVRFAELDGNGVVVHGVQSVPFAGGVPTALGLDCADRSCHALIAVDEHAHGGLYAVTFTPGSPPVATRFVGSFAVPSNVPPIVHGRDAYVVDTRQGSAHIRRLNIEW